MTADLAAENAKLRAALIEAQAMNQELRIQGLCNCGEFEGRLATAKAEAWEEEAKWHEEREKHWIAEAHKSAGMGADWCATLAGEHGESIAHGRARAEEIRKAARGEK